MNKKMLAAYLLVTTFSVCVAMSDFAQDCEHAQTSYENLNAPIDKQGNTYLHLAAQNNEASLLIELINDGAHWSRNNNGETPFHIAAKNGACDVLKTIISCTIQNKIIMIKKQQEIILDIQTLFTQENNNHRTALQCAIDNNKQEAKALLAQHLVGVTIG
jgi:ankyrin repeat protein